MAFLMLPLTLTIMLYTSYIRVSADDKCMQYYCTNSLLEKIVTLETKIMTLEKDNGECTRKIAKQQVETDSNKVQIVQLEIQKENISKYVQDQQNKVEELEKKVNTMENRNVQLSEQNGRMNGTISKLQNGINILRLNEQNLEESCTSQQAQLNKSKTDIMKLQEKHLALDDVINSTKTELISLITNGLRSTTTMVFFTAERIGDVILVGGQALVFNRVLQNVRNGYNSSTGIFVAPVNGTYLFSATILALYGKDGHFQIAKNKAEHVGMFHTGKIAGGYSSGSMTVVVALTVGDKVCVKVWPNPAYTDHVQGDGWSSFMGVLLQEIKER